MKRIVSKLQALKHKHSQSLPHKRTVAKIMRISNIIAIMLLAVVGIQLIFKVFIADKTFPRRITASNQTIAEALDGERVRDRILIRQALVNYFQSHNTYPMSLDELVPSFLSTLPVDPLTYEVYEYTPVDNKSDYKLCINFEAKADCVTSHTQPYM